LIWWFVLLPFFSQWMIFLIFFCRNTAQTNHNAARRPRHTRTSV
jgi:hypothetical protein